MNYERQLSLQDEDLILLNLLEVSYKLLSQEVDGEGYWQISVKYNPVDKINIGQEEYLISIFDQLIHALTQRGQNVYYAVETIEDIIDRWNEQFSTKVKDRIYDILTKTLVYYVEVENMAQLTQSVPHDMPQYMGS